MIQHIEDLKPLFSRSICDRLLITTPSRSVVVPAKDVFTFKLKDSDAYRFGCMGTISEEDVIVSTMDRNTCEVTISTDRGTVSIVPIACEAQIAMPGHQRALHS